MTGSRHWSGPYFIADVQLVFCQGHVFRGKGVFLQHGIGEAAVRLSHPSQRRVDWLIDITDAAYRRMQTDPLYEQQVLDYLAPFPCR